jgi:hypothetical protein
LIRLARAASVHLPTCPPFPLQRGPILGRHCARGVACWSHARCDACEPASTAAFEPFSTSTIQKVAKRSLSSVAFQHPSQLLLRQLVGATGTSVVGGAWSPIATAGIQYHHRLPPPKTPRHHRNPHPHHRHHHNHHRHSCQHPRLQNEPERKAVL